MADKFVVRTSDRNTFKRCRRLWNWTSPLREDLKPVAGAKPLEFGTAIHKALQIYYNPKMWDLPDREPVQHLSLIAFYEECRNQRKAREETGLWDIEAEEDFKERAQLGRGMLEHYFRWAPLQDRFTPLYSELLFEVPVPDPATGEQLTVHDVPVFYQGRLDAIVRTDDGLNWIMDHKTTKQFGDIGHLDLDPQCGSYAWAVQHMLNIPIQGVIYNELRKAVPQPPRQLKDGTFSVAKNQSTTHELFVEAVESQEGSTVKYKEHLEWLKAQPNTYFRRTIVHRSPRELELLGEQIASEAMDMLDFPRIYPNPSRINCYGCAFRVPCLATNSGDDALFLLRDPKLYAKAS